MPGSELFVNVEPTETRVALVEDGMITELHVERAKSRSIVGNVYLGRVGRVLPGMQAAFVDIGLDRHAFLQVTDSIRQEDFDALTDSPAEEGGSARRVSKQTPINQVLTSGQAVVVQVTRAPVGKKGARVTSHVSLAGRHLVYMPTLDRVGISRRIQEEKERKRLSTIIDSLRTSGGFIVRTVAEGVSEEVLTEDMGYLTTLWNEILEHRTKATAPALLHGDLDIALRAARDLLGFSVSQMVVDDAETYEQLVQFTRKFLPDQMKKVVHYDGDEPIFDAFGIEEEVQRALARVIPLPSGGSLVLDHAEALTAIDVNSGRYSGGKTLEETITTTNLEAVREVAYQLRLRNIGGLIVVDFIDMDRPSNREKVNNALREALRDDRAQTTAIRISELGLVEMTRKGTNQSLSRLLFEPCFYCDGTGQLRSRATVCSDIIREVRRRALELRSPQVMVQCHPRVAEVLSKDREHREAIKGLEQRFAKDIIVEAREDFHLERFDIKGGQKNGPSQRTS